MKQASKMMVWTDGSERDETFFKNSWDTEFLETYILLENKNEIKDFESTVDKNIVKILYLGISLNLFSWIIGITGIHLDYLKIDTGIDGGIHHATGIIQGRGVSEIHGAQHQ